MLWVASYELWVWIARKSPDNQNKPVVDDKQTSILKAILTVFMVLISTIKTKTGLQCY